MRRMECLARIEFQHGGIAEQTQAVLLAQAVRRHAEYEWRVKREAEIRKALRRRDWQALNRVDQGAREYRHGVRENFELVIHTANKWLGVSVENVVVPVVNRQDRCSITRKHLRREAQPEAMVTGRAAA